MISTQTCTVPLIDIFGNFGPEALDVSKRLMEVEVKVQQIDDLSLKLSRLINAIYPSNDTNIRNPATTGGFVDFVTKEVHEHITSAKNAVVFNILDRLPLPLV